MTICSENIPWPMVGGWITGSFIAVVIGCTQETPPPAPQAGPTNLVERVSSPDMIADLHRREREYFERQNREQSWPHPEPAHVVDVEWEPVFAPDGKQLQRTRIPGGWLVVYGDVAVVVTDSEHTWGAGR